MKTKITLSKADSGNLQDAWHYAMMLIKRRESGFDGDRDFPEGIRGQVIAYERLLAEMNKMAAGNETWELVESQWWIPSTFEQMLANAREALDAINAAAIRLGIDARTCERIVVCGHCKKPFPTSETKAGVCFACLDIARSKFVNSSNGGEMVLRTGK